VAGTCGGDWVGKRKGGGGKNRRNFLKVKANGEGCATEARGGRTFTCRREGKHSPYQRGERFTGASHDQKKYQNDWRAREQGEAWGDTGNKRS